MQLKQEHIVMNNEKGIVLVVVIMLMAVLVLLGTTAIMVTTTDMKISSNYLSGSQAFYIAEAGIEQARNNLRTAVSGCSTMQAAYTLLSSLLAARVGGNGALMNSSTITNFYNNGGFVTDDLAYVPTTGFGTGNYTVYLTNATPELVTSTTDGDSRLTLTSIGRGPNNSIAVIQEIVMVYTIPPMPGAIVLPGPTVNFDGTNSNASSVAGGPQSAISLNNDAARNAVLNDPAVQKRLDNYTCNTTSGAACINNEPTQFPAAYSTVSGINNLKDTITSMADTILTGNQTLTAAQVGTTANRQIVVVNGDATLGPVNGAGILVVTGALTLNGDFNYKGFIMVVGAGNVQRNGGGSGSITGGIFVANTNDATADNVLGIPTFNTAGGGNSTIAFDAGQLDPPGGRPFVRVSWKQM